MQQSRPSSNEIALVLHLKVVPDQINVSTHPHELLHLLLLHSRLKLSLLGSRKSVEAVSTSKEFIALKSHEPVHLDCMRGDMEADVCFDSILYPC